MRREAPLGVFVSGIALLAMLLLPFAVPLMASRDAERDSRASAEAAALERSGAVADGVAVKGARHGHDLPLGAPHWYATVHGDAGALAQVFAIDGSGKVLGPVLGPLPAREPPLSELRGMAVLGNGDLAVALTVTVDAASQAARTKIEAAGGSVTTA